MSYTVTDLTDLRRRHPRLPCRRCNNGPPITVRTAARVWSAENPQLFGLTAGQPSKTAGHRPDVFRAYRSSTDHQFIDLKAANCELLR